MKYLKNASTLCLISEKCDNCLTCIDVCPHAVFRISAKKVCIADIDSCMECGACALNCKHGAIEVKAGVGCASAIIKSILTGGPPSCDCGSGSSSDSNCC